jgi:2'-5' RNA ligase
MQFFIAIVPPEDYKEKILEFRNRWSINHISDPHVTLKAQSGLTEDLNWLANVREACSSFPRFQLSLSEPAMYGTAVTYLNVESKEIYNLHKRLMEVVSPPPELIKRYMELDRFHPHLTLGQTKWGLKEAAIEEMTLAAREALAPFPRFDVTFVRIYKEVETNRYVPFENIELKH